jgi:hypothetical protein
MKNIILSFSFVMISLAAGPKIAYYAPVPPPPAIEEHHGLAPGPGNIWIAGFWGYEGGRHVWHAGHWDKPPAANFHYVEPRWDRKGSQYAFREGHWQKDSRWKM